MDHEKGVEIDVIARMISDYFREYPNSADTANGVYKWWLSREQIRYTYNQVQSALEYLVINGSVVRTTLADGRILYSRNKSHSE